MFKKLFLGSISLAILSICIVLFQISCQKQAGAQTTNNYVLPPATTTSLGGVIIGQGLSVTSNGILSVNTNPGGGLRQLNKILYYKESRPNDPYLSEYWTANYDGSNKTKIQIDLPTGLSINGYPHLSPDGNIIIFVVGDSNSKKYIYSCNVDGSNLKKIIDIETNLTADLVDIY